MINAYKAKTVWLTIPLPSQKIYFIVLNCSKDLETEFNCNAFVFIIEYTFIKSVLNSSAA